MADRASDAIVVLITAPTREEAIRLADMLVGAHLAACVQILPEMESVYRWQGKIERAEEWLLLVKTTKASFEGVRDTIYELHSYEVPECISFSIENGGADYLQWIGESVGA